MKPAGYYFCRVVLFIIIIIIIIIMPQNLVIKNSKTIQTREMKLRTSMKVIDRMPAMTFCVAPLDWFWLIISTVSITSQHWDLPHPGGAYSTTSCWYEETKYRRHIGSHEWPLNRWPWIWPLTYFSRSNAQNVIFGQQFIL